MSLSNLSIKDKSVDKTDLYFPSPIGENVFLQWHVVNDMLGKNQVKRENTTKGLGSREWGGKNSEWLPGGMTFSRPNGLGVR